MTEGQTLRSEDKAFLPLSSGQNSLLCELRRNRKGLCRAAKKTLKQHVCVSSPLQVYPSPMFDCGIRVEIKLNLFPSRLVFPRALPYS